VNLQKGIKEPEGIVSDKVNYPERSVVLSIEGLTDIKAALNAAGEVAPEASFAIPAIVLADRAIDAARPLPGAADLLADGIYRIEGREAKRIFTLYDWNHQAGQDLERIKQIVEKHEGVTHWSYSGTLAARVERMMAHYQQIGVSGMASAKSARDNMLTWLRAMAIVADMTANAGTHGEKNARLRGIIDVTESAIEKLQQMDFDFHNTYWNFPDVFKSDYPVRHWMDRAHEAERKQKELEERIAELERGRGQQIVGEEKRKEDESV
jgi:hypothetical protein